MKKPYKVNDRFFQKAKAEGYRARSVYKLEAIQNRFKVLRAGDRVLDLGAAPGSFLQYIQKIIGPQGVAVGIDLKPIKGFTAKNILTLEADIFDENMNKKVVQLVGVTPFDVLTSDLAPSTTGIKSLDAGRSYELNNQVLNVAEQFLKTGGHVVMKLFPGVDEAALISRTKNLFKVVKVYRPAAVRQSSREVYIVGLKKRGKATI